MMAFGRMARPTRGHRFGGNFAPIAAAVLQELKR